MQGVLNVLKPPGMTSHDVVAFARRVLKEKKIGHTGTLDPAAAGVLPLCLGPATRLVEYLQAGTKEYVAEATFGRETDSGDLLGTTVAQTSAQHLTAAAIEEALAAFRGEICQTPPLHSAVKVEGKRLYEIAREGGEALIPTRQVEVSSLQAYNFRSGDSVTVLLKIECSGGTYVRSLVRDLGRALGTAAVMSFLVRTRSGQFHLRDSVLLEDLETAALKSTESALRGCFSAPIVDDEMSAALFQGKAVEAGPREQPSQLVLVLNSPATMAAVARRENGFYRAVKAFDLTR